MIGSSLSRLVAAFVTVGLCASAFPAAAANDALDPRNFDRSVSPAVDFYRYAVGGWRRTNPIPSDRTSWSSFDEIELRNELRLRKIVESPDQTLAQVGSERRKIGDFYAACTDVDDIEANGVRGLRNELAAIDALSSTRNVAPLVARETADGPDTAPGFAFGSEQDPKAATRVIASLGQGGLTLDTRDYYLMNDARSKDIRSAYRRFVRRSFVLLGDDAATAARETNDVLAFETSLARVSKAPSDLRDPFANYHPMPLAQLVSLAPDFDWSAYFAGTGVTGPGLARIDVGQPGFARGVNALVRGAPLAEWKSYLRWHALRGAGDALPRAFRDAAFAFTKNVYGVAKPQPRSRTCIERTDAALGFAVGKIYVAAYFPPAARERARREIASIRAALRADIATIAWMSPSTRASALRKLSKFSTLKVGYPDRWRDYSGLQVDRADFLADLLAANRFSFRRDVAKIGKPLDRSQWGLTPQTVNAYYDPSMNEIVIPAGILEPPFFDENADDAVNFGGIGVVIGHEMTHGYDDEGSDFDGDGNLHPIVTKADAARFQKRVACIVRQANAYEVAPGLHLNGKLVAGEATADLGGLTLAYRAMETSFAAHGRPAPIDGFTPEQRYYLSYAQIWRTNQRPQAERAQVLGDPHPVAAYRVDGTISDEPEFDRAFSVKPGSPMYRSGTQRCAVW
ncbi:MAG: M13 family metallopeptidase [Candidatus Eremiobacteraeota bacterium]|nr:M13 family metallopeptidase [Candidatus Eremiobacteraeota bacterium]